MAYDYAEDPDYDEFRDVLRAHMEETWPLGIGDELLGEAVMMRRLHSVRTAAHATGVDQRRLRKMLAARGLIPENGRPDAWEVFDAAAAEPLLEEIRQLVLAKTFAALIGASRSQFDRLVAGGALTPAMVEKGVKSVWDPADGRAFLDQLFAGAVQLRQAQHDWAHISKSAQRLKVNPVEIVAAIRDGRVIRVGNHADFEGYAALYVDHAEVSAVLSASDPEAQSIERFSKSVGIAQPSRLRRLILNGHTPATMMQNPRTRAQQLFITHVDAEAFHQAFFTIRTLAMAYGRSWQALTSDLKAAGVARFSPGGEDYGSVYRRSEVSAAII